AWQALLARYACQHDISVGAPIANRNRIETEGLIGFFVNQLTLRTGVEAEQSFVELLGRVREAALGAYAHQDLPFERLVEELRPERHLNRAPLFQTVFTLQNAAEGVNLEMAGFQAEIIEFERRISKFDLSLTLKDGPDGLSGMCEYA